MLAATPYSGVDLLMGVGGIPEGVIAACAIRALGGAMLGRLSPQSEGERQAMQAAGSDTQQIFTTNDLVSSDEAFFAATGITDGELCDGVRYFGGGAHTSSIVMRSKTGTVRWVSAHHNFSIKTGLPSWA